MREMAQAESDDEDFLKNRLGCSNENNGHLSSSTGACTSLGPTDNLTYPELDRAKPLIKSIMDSE